ncbi:dihydrouridine synthase 4-like protein [Xylariaceae sp. FL1019]|nr:dihydrouridine synthase 4-like protein [Xylariaceae sp. FL1019]
MKFNMEGELTPRTHPLKVFNIAKSQSRFVHACAPMVRYSKLAFRQTVHHYGTDLCWTPMILAKEFNRNQFARDSDLTMSTTRPEIPTIVQFGANSPLEISRASSLVAPFTNGVDLNCGCPQSWACASTLGAALMEQRDLVRDMLVMTRRRLQDDGWAVGMDKDVDDPKGRSVSVKIRVHKDMRKTVDFITTVLGHEHNRNIDWLTIHPRTRYTPSTAPINLEALELLTDMFGDKLPILVSGDVFTLSTLPYTSHFMNLQPTITSKDSLHLDEHSPDSNTYHATTDSSFRKPHLPKLAGLMSARALLANPALFAGYETCPWEAVDLFMNNVARAPLPLKLGIHHLTEMCGAGFGPDRSALLNKKERIRLTEFDTWIDTIDYLDDVKKQKRINSVVRYHEHVQPKQPA